MSKTFLVLLILLLLLLVLRLSGMVFVLSGWVFKLLLIVGVVLYLAWWLPSRRKRD
jgi:hypothetical protein